MVETEFGLVRFAGVRNVDWAQLSDQHQPGNNIRSLLTARDRTLWIGTLDRKRLNRGNCIRLDATETPGSSAGAEIVRQLR